MQNDHAHFLPPMHCVNQKQIKQTEGQNGMKVENKEIPASC